MRLNSGQPASERREGVKPCLALIRGVEAGATIADIQTTAATEQLLPLNPANRRIRTRMYGGVGGEEPRGSPLSRFTNRICYSPLPKRRDHHPARRGWVSVVVSEAGWAGAGAGDGSGWLRLTGAAASGWVSTRKLTFSRTVERRRAALSASWAVSASAGGRAG